MAFQDYSESASSNTSIGGISVAPGMPRENVDNAIRQLMADAKAFSKYAGTAVSVLGFIPSAEHAAIAAGTTAYDATANIQAALTAHKAVLFPDGKYLISNKLDLRTGQTVVMSPGVTIEQTTANRQIFYGSALTNLTFFCQGATLKGKGDYFGGYDHWLALQRFNAVAWTAATVQAVSSFRFNDGTKVYRCTVAGTTAGAGGPTGTGLAIVDGTVTWEYVGERITGTAPVFWTGNGGNDQRGFDFYSCTTVRIFNPRIINCGLAAIALTGTSNVLIDDPDIEGTHIHSTPIVTRLGVYEANVQHGIYLFHNLANGVCDRITIRTPEISGVTQGILNESAINTQPTNGMAIISPLIRDIPGQHAFYLQSGNVTIVAPRMVNIALAGVKVQSTVDQNNIDITNIAVTKINATNLGSNLIELVQPTGTGSIAGFSADGIGIGVGTGLGIQGKVSKVEVNLVISGAVASGLVIQGTRPIRDCYVKMNLDGSGDHGMVCTASDISGFSVEPIIRNAGNGLANKSAIICGVSGATLDVYDADISGTTALYALSASASGARINVRGNAKLSPGSIAIADNVAGAVIEGTIWRPYTATVTTGAGVPAPTVTSARYRIDNKKVELDVDFTLGGGTGLTFVTGPYNAAYPAAFSAFENVATGAIMRAAFRPADLTKIEIADAAGGNSAAAARRFVVTGAYEVA